MAVDSDSLTWKLDWASDHGFECSKTLANLNLIHRTGNKSVALDCFIDSSSVHLKFGIKAFEFIWAVTDELQYCISLCLTK